MRIAIDLDSGDVRSWAGQAVTGLRIKRGDRLPVEVRFTRNGATIERPSGATGKLGLKSAGDLDGDFVAFASAWTKTGSGSQTVYTFDLNTNTTELHALFSAEPASVALVMEIESSAPGELRSSATVAVTVENDVIRGDEGVPTDALDPYPLPAEIVRVSDINDTVIGTDQLGAADGVATLDSGGKVPTGQIPAGWLPLSGGTVTGDISLPNASFGSNNALTGALGDARYFGRARVADLTEFNLRQNFPGEVGGWETAGDGAQNTIAVTSPGGYRLFGSNGNAHANAAGGGVRFMGSQFTGTNSLAFNAAGGNWEMGLLVRTHFNPGNVTGGFFIAGNANATLWGDSRIGLFVTNPVSATWAATTAFTQGTRILVGTTIFICSTAGTTGGTEPTWGTTINGTTTDGTVTWRNLGPHTNGELWLMRWDTGTFEHVPTGVFWPTGSANNTLMILRGDGTNVYARVSTASGGTVPSPGAEVSISRGALTGGNPAIFTRNDAAAWSSTGFFAKAFYWSAKMFQL
jgi:hypothetical protein